MNEKVFIVLKYFSLTFLGVFALLVFANAPEWKQIALFMTAIAIFFIWKMGQRSQRNHEEILKNIDELRTLLKRKK